MHAARRRAAAQAAFVGIKLHGIVERDARFPAIFLLLPCCPGRKGGRREGMPGVHRCALRRLSAEWAACPFGTGSAAVRSRLRIRAGKGTHPVDGCLPVWVCPCAGEVGGLVA